MSGSGTRIIHLIPENGIGGVEVAARSMATQPVLPCDFKLLFIAGERKSTDSARVIQPPFRSPRNPIAHLRALLICLRYRPDVLIISLWKSVPVGLLVRLLRPRTRLVFFLHSETNLHVLDAWLSRAALGFADEVWADSRATLTGRLDPIKGKPTRVISFVTERLCPLADAAPKPRPRFVIWARLSREKGIDLSLNFIYHLSQRGIDARFEVWGPDQGELSALIQQAAELGIGNRVTFKGPALREQLPELATKASFLLQLSRTEGMGMAVVEAMQMGLVPVVTAVGEICRYVSDGDNGILVDPEHPRPALDNIDRLLVDPGEYRRIRENALGTWQGVPLYAEEVCAAAAATVEAPRHLSP